MTSTITRFEATLAPCGQQKGGERSVTEDRQGLVIEHVSYACGCRSTKEEFHDGSVHHMVVHHRGKVLVDEELRGE
ncbi:MAG: hypothetical protein ACRDPJ_06040 [Nocardioidaceae bacterium]